MDSQQPEVKFEISEFVENPPRSGDTATPRALARGVRQVTALWQS